MDLINFNFDVISKSLSLSETWTRLKKQIHKVYIKQKRETMESGCRFFISISNTSQQ